MRYISDSTEYDKSIKPTIFFFFLLYLKTRKALPRLWQKTCVTRFALEDKTRVVSLALSGFGGVQEGVFGNLGMETGFGQKASRRNPLSPRALASAARRKLLSASFDYFFFVFSFSFTICNMHGFPRVCFWLVPQLSSNHLIPFFFFFLIIYLNVKQ
jgi:hypothetical protein